DLAEIPTLQLLQQWKLDAASPREEIERRAAEQAREWANGLKLAMDGRRVAPQFLRASVEVGKGVLRVTSELRADTAPGKLTFEDTNFPERAGWKEIVIVAGRDATIDQASPSGTATYPQDVRAEVTWHTTGALPTTPTPVSGDYLSRLLHQGEIGWG